MCRFFVTYLLYSSACFEFFNGFYIVGSPDDEVEKAEGFKGEVGGGIFWFA